ncbi:hypothetical protein [Mycoplasma suis]|uniref:Uncharacterized protein n=1 Tax=Mycoplasma suis (strain Illinois) TaxID=768700 RepID=F0QQL6_MYCSL|nr:hypothetical protein [Mycoplasma suis]ADX97786.1 hypothetical protein MSU_0242 [Mycoplasma suis str. Illinois]
MDIPLLTKLLVSACTVGGGSFGAYVAGFTGNSKKDFVQIQEKGGKGVEGVKTPVKEVEESPETEIEDSSHQESDLQDEDNSKTTPKQEELDSQKEVETNPISPKEPEIQEFQDPLLQAELDSSENSGQLDLLNKEEEPEVKEEEERFDNFELYQWDEDEEDEDVAPTLEVAEYVQKTREERETGRVLEISCESWMRNGDGIFKKSTVDRNKCDSYKKRESWGKRGWSQPTSWVDVVKNKAKEVLGHYKLWVDKNSKFTNDEKSKWITKDESGRWECTRESSLNEKNFWIHCDFFSERR